MKADDFITLLKKAENKLLHYTEVYCQSVKESNEEGAIKIYNKATKFGRRAFNLLEKKLYGFLTEKNFYRQIESGDVRIDEGDYVYHIYRRKEDGLKMVFAYKPVFLPLELFAKVYPKQISDEWGEGKSVYDQGLEHKLCLKCEKIYPITTLKDLESKLEVKNDTRK